VDCLDLIEDVERRERAPYVCGDLGLGGAVVVVVVKRDTRIVQ
jgi:hypothetical protein